MTDVARVDARLEDLTEADFATVARLAEEIWHGHYDAFVGRAQVEYMLAGRFVPEKLRLYVGAGDRWFKLLFVGGEPVGYCSYSRTTPEEMKLEQLYLRAAMKGPDDYVMEKSLEPGYQAPGTSR